MLKSITCKLGNMAKVRDWSVYPITTPGAIKVIIQCSHRIAEVNLETGKVMLSSGKGGHQGFVMLSPLMGATLVDCPADVIEQLRGFVSQANWERPVRPVLT